MANPKIDEINIGDETTYDIYAKGINGILPIDNGGTGASNASAALTALGAAPAGYGLGEFGKTIGTSGDLNSITACGWYRWTNNASQSISNIPTTIDGTGSEVRRTGIASMLVASYSANMSCQIIFGHSASISGEIWARSCNAGTFLPWVRLKEGTDNSTSCEYATGEIFNGKMVYKRVAVLSTMSGSSRVRTRIIGGGSAPDTSIVPVRVEGTWAGNTIPTTNVTVDGTETGVSIDLYVYANKVTVKSNGTIAAPSDYSDTYTYITLYYTK